MKQILLVLLLACFFILSVAGETRGKLKKEEKDKVALYNKEAMELAQECLDAWPSLDEVKVDPKKKTGKGGVTLDTLLNKLVSAQHLLEKALAFAPLSSLVRNNLGVVLMRQGKLAQARKAFLSVLQTDPTHEMALSNLNGVQDHLQEMLGVVGVSGTIESKTDKYAKKTAKVGKTAGKVKEVIDVEQVEKKVAPASGPIPSIGPAFVWTDHASSLFGKNTQTLVFASYDEEEAGDAVKAVYSMPVAAEKKLAALDGAAPASKTDLIVTEGVMLMLPGCNGDVRTFVRMAEYFTAQGLVVLSIAPPAGLPCWAPLTAEEEEEGGSLLVLVDSLTRSVAELALAKNTPLFGWGSGSGAALLTQLGRRLQFRAIVSHLSLGHEQSYQLMNSVEVDAFKPLVKPPVAKALKKHVMKIFLATDESFPPVSFSLEGEAAQPQWIARVEGLMYDLRDEGITCAIHQGEDVVARTWAWAKNVRRE